MMSSHSQSLHASINLPFFLSAGLALKDFVRIAVITCTSNLDLF